MNQKLLNAKALFQGHITFRHAYYRFFRKMIMRGITSRALSSLSEKDLMKAIQTVIPISKERIKSVSEEERKAIVQAADKTLMNTFNYLGSGDVVMNPVRWDTDFISGFKWVKGTYYKRYVQVNLENHADVKLPRELSRGHFLLHLALAYVFTEDKKYADKAVALIEDWIDNNPFLKSINWCCAMDVAIRAVNWMWALAIMGGYKLERNTSEKIAESLYQHGWYIFRNLEGNRLAYNGNHYYSDLVGLLHLGLLFKKDAESSFWFSFGEKELFREMRLQVLPSGMHYEGSTNYHRLVLELTLPCVALLKKNQLVVPPDIDARLKSMFDLVDLLVMPNGEMPIIGDQDNGRCLPLGVEDVNDYRYLLDLRTFLYYGSDSSNIYCVAFENLKNDVFSLLEKQERDSGLVLLKDAGFTCFKDENWYCLLNVDNQGLYRDEANNPGHTHADWLSFVLACGGEPFIVDPGTFVYSSNPELRNKFRSTMMHNTLVIDGKSQSDIPQKFLWSLPRKKTPELRICDYREGKAIIESDNFAFCSTEESIIHKRQVQIDGERIAILDNVQSQRNHHIDLYYYLKPGVAINNNGNHLLLSINDISIGFKLQCSCHHEMQVESCKISEGYGNITSTMCIHVIIDGRNLLVKTVISRVK